MRSVTRPIRKYRWSHVFGVATAFALLTSISLSVNAQNPASSSTAQTAAASGQNPVVLDSVIAIINGEVLLESDLQEEMDFSALQPLSLPGGKGLEQRAAQRLINRALIVQQMKEQGMASDISDQEVQENLDALRKQLPACVAYKCETEAGWARFLSDHSLTPSEVQTRWRQRMEILRFIDARFRAGVRIPNAEISNYYNKTFVPEFKKQNAHPPELSAVSKRIEEILLQQHVSALLQDWLKSLRDQGSVQILDPRFDTAGQATGGSRDDDGDGE